MRIGFRTLEAVRSAASAFRLPWRSGAAAEKNRRGRRRYPPPGHVDLKVDATVVTIGMELEAPHEPAAEPIVGDDL
jgi:hypothetical protein